ncbi:MAG: NADH-quinone oxidoreductase subunit N [Gaiellales bacterium]|nr:MAG: NADH-quinone oxidoreductase subunit N [Gaiellales bacterium]
MDAHDVVALVPELMLVLAAIVLLLVDPLLPRDGRRGLSWLGVAPCVTAIVVTWWTRDEVATYFNGAVVNDRFAVYFKILLLAVAIVAMLLSEKHLHLHDRLLSDYYALVLFTTVGMMVMVAAIDLVTFFVGLELMALSSYILAGFFRYDSKSIEASLKYFLTGSFASVFLLLGMALLYGTTGATSYYAIGDAIAAGDAPESVMVLAVVTLLAGFAYKVAAAPFHNWAPDVYQGSPTPAAAFLSVAPKIAVFATIIRFLTHMLSQQNDIWAPLFIVIAIGTMLIGATMAIVQTDLKRMLAYSSIAHVGYLLLALAAEGYADVSFGKAAILYYLAAYAFMNMGAFGVLVHLANRADFDYSLEKVSGIYRRYPWTAGIMTLFMLSLAGIPPTAGFFAKFYLFAAVVNSGLAWLAVIGVLFSLVSAFYYLRVIVYMYMRDPDTELEELNGRSVDLGAGLGLAALAVVALGIFPGPVLDNAQDAVHKMFTGPQPEAVQEADAAPGAAVAP